MQLRPYQTQAKQDVYTAWAAGLDPLVVLPTGAGKTVVFSEIIKEHVGASCAIAHRQELVSQISLALARDGVKHRIIGPKAVVRLCVKIHMQELGRSWFDPAAQCGVAGVDTLVRRSDALDAWLKTVTLWVQDEAHHVLKTNKWGTAAGMFPNAKGLGVTATPRRADGMGLGRHADGLFDCLVQGPSMRDLINQGYLTEYRVFAPPSDIDYSDVTVGASGELNAKKLKAAVRRSTTIIGDVVKHYLKHAPGKLGVTFASDVETATDIAARFNAAGVPAAVVSAKTPDAERIDVLRRFKLRELLQLVNVDLFGEGFDLPAIEVVSMVRKTESYALYVQQFGRALRLLAGKIHALIIDHVGNVERHGLPDAAQVWTLDRREKRAKSGPSDVIPTRACVKCTSVFERIYNTCPFCGHVAVPADRSSPEQVDGDLIELDAAALAVMRGDVAKVDLAPALLPWSPNELARRGNVNRHVERQDTQKVLREAIAWWGGHQRAAGRPDSESYRRFYFKFRIDVLSAQALGTKDALVLAEQINEVLGNEYRHQA